MNTENKKNLIVQYQYHEKDTGSSEVQVALLTERINHLNEHLKLHKQDNATRYGLMKLVGRRRRLLSYIKSKDEQKYLNIIQSLNLRR